MTTDKAAFIGDKRKIETFKEHFLKRTGQLLNSWKNEYDLALAMGDKDAASKEKIKVDAMTHVHQLCEEASHEKTLDGVVKAFTLSLGSIKRDLRQKIEKAQSTGEKDHEIKLLIELGIYDKPIRSIMWRTLKDVGGATPQYQEFVNREH